MTFEDNFFINMCGHISYRGDEAFSKFLTFKQRENLAKNMIVTFHLN
jgi:hypothetical protein